jgi:hypothetical protein
MAKSLEESQNARVVETRHSKQRAAAFQAAQDAHLKKMGPDR